MPGPDSFSGFEDKPELFVVLPDWLPPVGVFAMANLRSRPKLLCCCCEVLSSNVDVSGLLSLVIVVFVDVVVVGRVGAVPLRRCVISGIAFDCVGRPRDGLRTTLS